MKKFKFTYQDDLISDDLLNKYLKGELSESENQKFHDLADRDDFLRDAAEGYHSVSGSADYMQDVKKSGSKLFSGNKNIFFYIIPSFVILSVSLILIFSNSPTEENHAENNNPGIASTEEYTIYNKTETAAKSDQISAAPEKLKVSELKTNYLKPLKEKNPEEFIMITSKGPSFLLPDDNPAYKYYDIDPNIYINPGNTITYYHDLKVFKYPDNRKNTSDRSMFDLGSLEPEFQNQQDKTNNTDNMTDRKIQYSDFLKFSLKKFINNNYSESINDLHIILNQFPDDINALFYSGLCYYYLNMPDKAIVFFNKTINHPIKTFDQESEWYLALSYLKNQKSSEAKKILYSIAEKDGFYALKAEAELEKME